MHVFFYVYIVIITAINLNLNSIWKMYVLPLVPTLCFCRSHRGLLPAGAAHGFQRAGHSAAGHDADHAW